MVLVGSFEGVVRKLSFFFSFLIFFGFFVFTSGAYPLYTLSFAKGPTVQNPCKFLVQTKRIDVRGGVLTAGEGRIEIVLG